MSDTRWVYTFGGGKSDGNASMRQLLGGKGANLCEMTNLGIRVPPGFTITTEACHAFQETGDLPEGLETQVRSALAQVEKWLGQRYGDAEDPLLVSVRSGAAVSMPGMMDTVLNLGLNDRSVEGLARRSGDERFAWDCYRRFVQMYGDVVMGLKPEDDGDDPFEERLAARKKACGVKTDVELKAADLKALVSDYVELIKARTGTSFPQDPWEQLWGAVRAVFLSWDNPRAVAYRRIYKLSNLGGTAVNVQAMVFGNLGDDCATGVAFTRDPGTGERVFFGEYLLNAQGEDVVAGIRTPLPLTRDGGDGESLEEKMPEAYRELVDVYRKLESHYGDMQDLEFTIQRSTLYLLQTRNGKRTGHAAVRIAVEMVDEGLIDEATAVRRVEPESLVQLLSPTFDPEEKQRAIQDGRFLAKGLNAGPGAASGRVVLSAEKAMDMVRNKGEKVLLVRVETSPEDIQGMEVAEGILTARGGMTSHAAVVARGMGKSCVAGCSALEIDYTRKEIRAGDVVVKQGDWLSIDGTTGEVLLGEIPTRPSEIIRVLVDRSLEPEESPAYKRFARLLEWADRFRKLGVRTNADQPGDAAVARAFGAEGIGLCRTEHMFFGGDRIMAVREMILAEDETERRRALAKLLPMQREDFDGIFRAMEGLPVTVRLLDPPLHEFLPHERPAQERLAADMQVPLERLRQKMEQLSEFNPMLGHRGCRLGITYPEIYETQIRAIFEAACDLVADGVDVQPEVMIPLVGTLEEFQRMRDVTDRTARQVMSEKGQEVPYLVGTMIEVPRACLVAGSIGAAAEFFSFGTNDLTQMTFGYSRDDAGVFLSEYVGKGVLPGDPFESLDTEGVGELVRMGTERG
ncbi:MAG: pyruvate, phosphate dikinase, partial [Acidobacteriota bacterium]